MATFLDRIHGFLWNEKFWLGDDAKWEDFVSDDPSVYYPRIRDMNWSIVVGFLLMFVRLLYERYIIKPLALHMGMKERKPIHFVDSPVLEAAYKKFKMTVPKDEMKKLVKQTDMTERQIERWFFKRRIKSMPSSMYKFQECGWQLLFYTASFTYGLYALWNKSWFSITVNCWIGWPKQNIDTDMYILYLMQLSFYWSLLFAVAFQSDYRKKDRTEMVTHHIVTLLLIYFSWSCNFVRVGSLVIVVHDAADPFLNFAKMAKYTKHESVCEVFFIFFILTWIISRIFVYPLWVLNASAVEIHDYVTTFPAYWFFNGLLFVLQLLHIRWTYLILNIAFEKLSTGAIKKDIRSESDSELSDSVEEATPAAVKKPAVVNGISLRSRAVNNNI